MSVRLDSLYRRGKHDKPALDLTLGRSKFRARAVTMMKSATAIIGRFRQRAPETRGRMGWRRLHRALRPVGPGVRSDARNRMGRERRLTSSSMTCTSLRFVRSRSSMMRNGSMLPALWALLEHQPGCCRDPRRRCDHLASWKCHEVRGWGTRLRRASRSSCRRRSPVMSIGCTVPQGEPWGSPRECDQDDGEVRRRT